MAVKYWLDWPEIIGFILLVIGFFAAVISGSAVIAYTLVLMAGFMGGRIWFTVKQKFKAPWSIILMGFLVGFMLGSRYGNKKVIVLFYIIGILVSYYLHNSGIIKSLDY